MTRTVSDPDTHFTILRSETPVTVDGIAMYAPTGEVECDECGRIARNVDEIPHAPDCPQRFVRTRWWRRHLRE